MIETQLTRTKKMIGPNWRVRCEDHSYDLRFSIKWTKDENFYI